MNKTERNVTTTEDKKTSGSAISRGKFVMYLALVLPALWALLAACNGGGGGGRQDHQ
jgi:hypothetical protein